MASSNHDCTYMPGMDLYRIAWTVDYKIAGSRQRFTRTTTRNTDEAGARAFCKRWGIDMPSSDPPADKGLTWAERAHDGL